MSEWNTIYDNNNNIVGTLRHGVAWQKSNGGRLGEYDDQYAYDNDRNIIAKIVGSIVEDMNGKKIGHVIGKELYISNEKVGHYIGSQNAGAAAIALVLAKYVPSNS